MGWRIDTVPSFVRNEPSWSADARVSALHEGANEGADGSRRIIFNVGNISEHQKVAGALQAVQECKASLRFLRILHQIAPSHAASQPGRQPARPGQA